MLVFCCRDCTRREVHVWRGVAHVRIPTGLSVKELKTKVLQCFFKNLFQLHKISTFFLAENTFSFFCWSIFFFSVRGLSCFSPPNTSSEASAFLSSACVLCPMLQPFPPTTSHRLTVKKKKRKTKQNMDCLACFLPLLHSRGCLGQSEWKCPQSMGKSLCHWGWTSLLECRQDTWWMGSPDAVPGPGAQKAGQEAICFSTLRHCSVISKELVELRIGLIWDHWRYRSLGFLHVRTGNRSNPWSPQSLEFLGLSSVALLTHKWRKYSKSSQSQLHAVYN